MGAQDDKMYGFEFLVGDWNLDYRFPISELSNRAGTGNGSGTIRRILRDKYVCFDYFYSLSTGQKTA